MQVLWGSDRQMPNSYLWRVNSKPAYILHVMTSAMERLKELHLHRQNSYKDQFSLFYPTSICRHWTKLPDNVATSVSRTQMVHQGLIHGFSSAIKIDSCSGKSSSRVKQSCQEQNQNRAILLHKGGKKSLSQLCYSSNFFPSPNPIQPIQGIFWC